ncbi:hypothetical protein [Methyloraptor flagellatus]|uniref:Uncharacterized protein n=1 Tax=Methyloraptor flagellatus TaxID=3162530 RepID=A0AAU7XH68_9HYPH
MTARTRVTLIEGQPVPVGARRGGAGSMTPAPTRRRPSRPQPPRLDPTDIATVILTLSATAAGADIGLIARQLRAGVDRADMARAFDIAERRFAELKSLSLADG